jgi:AmmeMemoRadiSam system protein B
MNPTITTANGDGPSSSLERPRLRPGLVPLVDENDPRHVVVFDRLHLSPLPRRITLIELTWMQLFDGTRTLRDIQMEAMRQAGGRLLPIELFASLVEKLDEALFLESPRFKERLHGPVREPSCIGCYPSDADEVRRYMKTLFQGRRSPGLPGREKADGHLLGALIPHIDYQRGGATFAWAFKEVFERTDASLFVIIGTSHYGAGRFTLTRKNFRTPLGVVPADQQYIDRLVARYGDGLFDDEVAHLPEHSIELEVVFLQYLYENRRPIRIVPVIVGSFEDRVIQREVPRHQNEVGRMIKALRLLEEEAAEPICYIISGDLAHIGPKFGDPTPVKETQVTQSRDQDHRLLHEAEEADMEGYFDIIAEEQDCRRICGLPPTYTLIEALRPRSGKLLHYDQYVDPRGHESVSFASVAFYR